MKKEQKTIKRILLRKYLLSIIIPLLILGFVLTYFISQLTREKSITEVVISNNKSYDDINSSFRSATIAMNKFKSDKALYDKLSYFYWSYRTTLPFSDYNEFQNTLDYFPDYISDIQVFTSNQTILNSQFIKKTTESLKTEEWYQETLKRNGNTYFFYVDETLYLSALLKRSNIYRDVHVICIKMNMEKIYDIMHNSEYSNIFVDDMDHIISSNVPAYKNLSLEEAGLQDINDMGNGINNYGKSDYDNAVVTAFIPEEGNSYFKIITFINNKQHSRIALNAIMISFVIIILSFIVSFFSITLFSRSILRKFMLIKEYMHNVARGNFNYLKIEDEEIIEFDNLFHDLDIMSQSLTDLIKQVYDVTIQKNEITIKNEEMKFKLLSNQINPHFLINTLETIRMKSFINGDKELADIVKCLSRLMRYNLEVKGEEVELTKEIEHMVNYFEIQKFRFRDRLSYSIDKKNMPSNYLILPLLIQPVIENAVIHGFERTNKDMEIKVFFENDEEYFKIIVLDNGSGISDEKLDEIHKKLESLDEMSGNHIGLMNIHHRSRLYYGEKYGIEIYSELDSYTKVILKLPQIINYNDTP